VFRKGVDTTSLADWRFDHREFGNFSGDRRPMTFGSLPSPRQAKLVCAFAATTMLLCGGLFVAAASVPAPPMLLPLIAAVCIGCPIVGAWNLPISVAVLRGASAERRDRAGHALGTRALAELRRSLDRLPETEHPLGH
jgi:hypothetical protein